MTLTRYRTKGSRLTVEEADANLDHLELSENHTYTPDGDGAVAETVQAALRHFVHTAQYDTVANWRTAKQALTGTLGFGNFEHYYAMGTAAAGLTEGPFLGEVIFTGHSGGTTDVISFAHTTTVEGANDVARAIGGRSNIYHSGSGVLADARGTHHSVAATSTGNITDAVTHSGRLGCTSSGSITGTGAYYTCKAPDMSGTGTIATEVGYRVENIGHATLITNMVGVYVEDQTGCATSTRGFRSALTSGTGKRNLYIDGTAENYIAARVRLGIDSTSSVGGEGQQLEVEGLASSASSISVKRNANGVGDGYIAFAKSRGAALNSNTIVQSGDQLGTIYWYGADGNDMASEAAKIIVKVDGTPGSNDMPGRMEFYTTADGAAAGTLALTISANQTLKVATLAGVGTRTVVADANGVLSAP